MVERIIYPTSTGGVCILICHREDGTPLTDLPITEVARKDVPAGVPYRFVLDTDIPSDRSQRELWTADFTSPDGYGIGAEAWFSEQSQETAE